MPAATQAEVINQLHNFSEKRTRLFSKLQNIFDYSSTLNSDNVNLFLPRFENMQSLQDDFEIIQDKIASTNLLLNQENRNEKLDVMQVQNAFDNLLYDVRGRYLNLVKSQPRNEPINTSSHMAMTHPLPRINVPTFEGDIAQWSNFLSIFSSVVHTNSSLSVTEKFVYLKSFLRSDALAVISGFELVPDNYELAFTALKDRYQNKRRLAVHYFNQIKDFVSFSSPSQANLQRYLNVHSSCINALKALALPELSDFLLFQMALGNLDNNTIKLFENKQTSTTIPSYQDLIDFVTDQSRSYEIHSAELKPIKCKISSSSRVSNSLLANSASASKAENSSETKIPCALCKKHHSFTTCPEFLKQNVAQRYTTAKHLRRCFNCLGAHSRLDCKSINRCRECGSKKHHTFLHSFHRVPLQDSPSTVVNNSTQNEMKLVDTTQTLSCQISDAAKMQTVLLGTVQALIQDDSGMYHPIRAVIDPGSQISAITHTLVQKLGIKCCKSPIQIQGISNSLIKTKGMVNCELKSRHNSLRIQAHNIVVLSTITTYLPSAFISSEICQRFQQLELADEEFYKPSRIDFLIGADLYPHILCTSSPNTLQGYPAAFNTLFGWVVIGKVNADTSQNQLTSLLIANPSLDDTLRKFWETEEVSNVKITNPQDQECESHFIQTHYRDGTGRYVVALPFSKNCNSLGKNRQSSLMSYLNMETRLAKRPQLNVPYKQFLQEYLNHAHMENSKSPSSYVLPHHCVLKDSSTSTKVRVVFNGSASSSTGVSLNQTLLPGPKLQQDLGDILISFRLNAVAVCTDIKMMYRQILIAPQDRKFQHIFWRPSQGDSVVEFQLNTVTYGLTSSAYLAQRVLLQLVEDEGKEFPGACHALRKNTYVDDIVTGASSINEARKLTSELVELLSRGGFQLRKWSSNEASVLDSFPEEHLETPLIFSTEDSSIKILGLMWDPKSDSFMYHIQPFEGTVTKRSVLSYIARIFDPQGWLTPVVFWTKYFLQRIWLARLGWDENLPEGLITAWKEFSKNLLSLSSLKIPRKIVSIKQSYRLIGFCDASEKGFAAVIYIQVTDNQPADSVLLKAKSKVAPLKILSIPRLELCGALLLAKLMYSVLQNFSSDQIADVYYFTDAQLVLTWLKTPPHMLKTFVANRIVSILELTNIEQWNHVASEENPADCASRGLQPAQLLSHSLWFNGPEFLKSSPNSWVQYNESCLIEDEDPERKERCSLITNKTEESYLCSVFSRYSSLRKLQRVMAYVRRFLHNLRNSTKRIYGFLSTDELRQSLLTCVSVTQQQYFSSEIRTIAASGTIPKHLRSLTPFIDPTGLLRVGGRLEHSLLSQDAKHPLLLPKKAHISHLICDYYHLISLHSGPRTVQALICSKFWILSLRSLVRQRIYKCLRCFRLKAQPPQPVMGNLPPSRSQLIRPFYRVGVDFAGPFTVKESKLRKSRNEKGYLCLFVCMAIKSLHLEFVSELSTKAFLAAFDRFVSRRGLPHDVYSDCGRNFVGASRQIKEIVRFLQDNNDKIFSSLSDKQIHWHFNPPAAPNFGGLWEAGVKSAKTLMIRIIGNSILTFEEYSTLFSRIEAVLNSRPLCAIPSTPEDGIDYLSPGHFLIGHPLISTPEQLYEENLTLHCRWQRLKQMTQTFWRRWSHEYLHTQMQRNKWTKGNSNLKIGDVVFIQGTESTPLSWPIGRIDEIHPGPDDTVRVVTVRTTSGTLVRPVNKLYVLPTQ